MVFLIEKYKTYNNESKKFLIDGIGKFDWVVILQR